MGKVGTFKKPNHKIVPNGSLHLNLKTEEKLTKQVSEYVRKGTIPAFISR